LLTLGETAGDLLEAGDDPVAGKRDAGAARVGVASLSIMADC
jgi:hypothetical protein